MIDKSKNLIYKFLRKSQKFTKTDNVYIATQGSYLGIGNIIGTIASLLLAMAFARLLPKEIYGQYTYILSIITIVGVIALPGMESAIIQAMARGFEGTFKKILKTRFKWGLWGGLISIAIGFFFLITQHDFTLFISFLAAGFFFPFMETSLSYLSYLAGKKLFNVQVKYSTLSQIISTLIIIITLFLTKNLSQSTVLIALILAYFSTNTILRIYFLSRTLKKYPPNENHDPKSINFGKHLTVLEVVSTIGSQLVNILLFNFLGAVQLAIYSFVVLPIRQMLYFLKNIRQLILPKLASRTREEIKKTLLKKVGIAFLFIIPIIIIYIIVAPYLYKIFFPQYMESVFYSQLFSLTLLAFPVTVLSVSFEAKMMKKQLYQINILASVIKIIILSIFVPIYGILGAVIAQLLSQFFYVVLALIFFKKM